MATEAWVRLWGRKIGAVALGDGDDVASFEYEPTFANSGIEVSPLVMSLSNRVYSFPGLPQKAFYGLPGLLADSLPDRFGNALINAWLATQQRSPDSFNAIERLCYTGRRGMGALEFSPVTGPRERNAKNIHVDKLVDLASEILSRRNTLQVSYADKKKQQAMADILRVGTSAGGARAKALIAWNRQTNEVRSGQMDAGEGFEHWLLKFDGVKGNRDKELDDPRGYGAIEYACYLMARDCGIEMTECRLFEEGDRRHFMTRRFDRSKDGKKRHMQTLGALAHFDFNMAGAYSYEQAFMTIRQLDLPRSAIEQQFRRMVFNIIIRNQDDHVKNIAFLMNKAGQWALSPAYDVTYSYNPTGPWTATHQMTMNGKRSAFTMEDFKQCARVALMKRGQEKSIISEITDVVSNWGDYARDADIPGQTIDKLRELQRRLTKWRTCSFNARINVNDHIGNNALRHGRLRQKTRIRLRIGCLNKPWALLRQIHRSIDFCRRNIASSIEYLVDAVTKHRLGLADLCGTNANRASRHLHVRNRRAFMCFGMRATRDAIVRQCRRHLIQITFETIEINTQSRRVQLPFRDVDRHLSIRVKILHLF